MEDLLAQTIKARLAELGLSYRKADAACGLTEGSIAAVIYGKSRRPTPATLQALAAGLGLSYRQLALAAYGVAENDKKVVLSP